MKEQYLTFLDELRKSGITNMFGASKYLEEAFGLGRKESKETLMYWMHTFEDRHSERSYG